MEPKDKVKPAEFSNSIDKTLSVIDCIFEEEGTFNDIQKKLNLPKATLHRILQSLESHDLIEKVTPGDTYRLGLKFIYYSEMVKKRLSLPSLAEGFLKALASDIGENTSLTVLYQQHCMSLIQCSGEDSALTSNLLPFPALNTCSSGKLFLSRWDDSSLRSFFSKHDLAKPTHNTIVTFEDFKTEQKRILENGISYDDEENEYGLFCMSVPLYNHRGPINANIGITAPKSRLMMKDTESIEEKLRNTAKTISDILVKIKFESPF